METSNPTLEATLHRSLRQGKGGPEIHAQLAELRLAANDYRGARDQALKGLSRAPNHAASLVALANRQGGSGKSMPTPPTPLHNEEATKILGNIAASRVQKEPAIVEEWWPHLVTTRSGSMAMPAFST